MLILCLYETMDQLAMENRARWHGHVLKREDGHALRWEDGHVLRRALVDGRKGGRRGHGRRSLRKKV